MKGVTSSDKPTRLCSFPSALRGYLASFRTLFWLSSLAGSCCQLQRFIPRSKHYMCYLLNTKQQTDKITDYLVNTTEVSAA